MDTISEIKFECGACRQRILVDGSAAGMSIDCPSCRRPVTIPKAGEAPTPKRPREMPRRAAVSGSLRAKIDAASVEFADPELAPLRQELVEASAQISSAEAEIEDLRAQLAAARAEAEKHRAGAVSVHAEIKSEKHTLRSEVAQWKQKLDLARAETEQARAEANGLTGELAVSQQETEAVRQQLREREIEFAEVCTGLAEAQADRTAILREIQTLQELRAKLEGELSTARAGLATTAKTEAQLQAATQELANVRALHITATESGRTLGLEIEALKAETAKLRQSMSESSTGRELIETRDKLAASETARDRFAGEARQLRDDARKHDTDTAALQEQLKSTRLQLEETRRNLEARSDSQLEHDNGVLRGIVERQNSDLTQKHALIVKFKRARFALRLVYALFFLALVAIGVIAMKSGSVNFNSIPEVFSDKPDRAPGDR